MTSFHEAMYEYKKQLKMGYLQEAYQGLMAYFGDLRAYFKKKYSDYSVSSSIYYGYMDMTYFALLPESIKRRKLKIAIVFVHDTFRFEVWLSGVNRDVQAQYCERIKEVGWNKYHLTSNPRSDDYILGHTLIDEPDFSDLDSLTNQIENGTLEFIRDVEDFLSKQNN